MDFITDSLIETDFRAVWLFFNGLYNGQTDRNEFARNLAFCTCTRSLGIHRSAFAFCPKLIRKRALADAFSFGGEGGIRTRG